MTMKNIINKTKAVVAAMLVVVMATMTSCYQKFEESWDLAINTNNITFSHEEGMIAVACFTTGHWTARLDHEIVWGHLENTSGNGTGYVRFFYNLNTSVSRAVDLILEAEGKQEIIHLIQRTGIGEGAVAFDRSSVTYANGKYKGRLEIQTNLPDEAFAEAAPILTTPEGATASQKQAAEGEVGDEPATPAVDWITDVVYHPAVVTGQDEAGYDIKTAPYITFTVQPNTTGVDREAVMKYGLVDASGTEYYAVANLTQEAADGYIILNDTTVTRDEQSGIRVAVSTNLTEYIDDMTTSVSYQTEGAADYVSNVVMTTTGASFDIAENHGLKRIAIIKVSYTDLDGKVTEGSLRVIQRGETVKREVSAESVRELLTSAGDHIYASVNDDTGDYADYINVIVIGSGAENLNMRKPENTAAKTQNHTLNTKTAYVQTLDGKYGFRIDFADAASNTLSRGDKFSLLLDGLTIRRANSPVRYQIVDPSVASFYNLTSDCDGEIVTKSKSISELTDNDVYTDVKLQNMEFVYKGGAYVYGQPTMSGAPEGGHEFRAHYATMMQDSKGKAIFALINAQCTWKRDLPGGTIIAPQGVGSVHGVLVHCVDEAYGGNIGKYSIRPYDASSFEMSTEKSYAVNQLVDWRLDKQTISINNYTWNGASTGGFVTGTANDAEAKQNKLHGVHGITDGSAVFYTTNLKVMASHTAITGGNTTTLKNFSYLPAIQGGDKSPVATNSTADITSVTKGTALVYYHDVASFYKWNSSGQWTGETTGFVAEFPATAASGTMAISFSTTPSPFGSINNANAASKYMYKGCTYGYPLYWKVECSTDNGATWTECTNAINGTKQYKLNPMMNWLNPQALTNHLTGVSTSVYTNSDFCPGFTQQKFFLPTSATGAANVMVKISPASLRIAWFSNNGAWNGSMDTEGNDCTSTYSYPCAVIFEDIAITYAN